MSRPDLLEAWAHIERGFAALSGRRPAPTIAHDDQFYIDTLRAVSKRSKPVRLYPADAARILQIIERGRSR